VVEVFCEVRDAHAAVEPLKVTCFGGKREPGEHPDECIARECREELGWTPPGLFWSSSPRGCVLYVDGQLIAWFYRAPGPPGDVMLSFEDGRTLRPSFASEIGSSTAA
jgi:8-oxo-dGTP pyrophosphatase MutT (NUDIX family)